MRTEHVVEKVSKQLQFERFMGNFLQTWVVMTILFREHKQFSFILFNLDLNKRSLVIVLKNVKKRKKKNTVFLHIKYLKSQQIYGGQCKTVLLK